MRFRTHRIACVFGSASMHLLLHLSSPLGQRKEPCRFKPGKHPSKNQGDIASPLYSSNAKPRFCDLYASQKAFQ
jgi:hypothetical protein